MPDCHLKIEVLEDAEAVAFKAAGFIAEEARQAINRRGCFSLAVSGGRTPWKMLRLLTLMDLPWRLIHIFQVDERIAPEGHPDRNLNCLLESLSENSQIIPENIHPMPVDTDDPERAAIHYALELQKFSGIPPVLDLVHLGLGPDGHTASLVPGDPVLDITGNEVAITGIYQGRRRMTLTYPALNRARRILWLVTGSEKSEMLEKLINGDVTIPAGRITNQNAYLIADREAANLSGILTF